MARTLKPHQLISHIHAGLCGQQNYAMLPNEEQHCMTENILILYCASSLYCQACVNFTLKGRLVFSFFSIFAV